MANKTVIVRTSSQLPEVTEISSISTGSVMEISILSAGYYDSMKIKYKTLNEKIQSDGKTMLYEKYGLTEGVNVGQNLEALNNLAYSTGQKNLSGTVIFQKTPYVGSTSDENQLLDKKTAVNLVGDVSSCFVGSDSTTYDMGCLTACVKESTSIPTVTCEHSGNLMLYGWMIDAGSVSPAQAYVSLQAKLGGVWTDIQHSPWIIGQHHSHLQYVTFNISVRKNLEIRIVSGFDLGTDSSYNQNKKNTLTNSEINVFRAVLIS